jgi:hypothetical protein
VAEIHDQESDASLSSVLPAFAVLLPERFRGGCAFGSGSDRSIRSLPRESNPN